MMPRGGLNTKSPTFGESTLLTKWESGNNKNAPAFSYFSWEDAARDFRYDSKSWEMRIEACGR